MNTVKEWLKKVGSYPHPMRYFFYQKLKQQLRPALEETYWRKIKTGKVERPYYGYCIHEAALQAKALGYPRISVIEFGVAGGNGLVNIESHVEAISKESGIEFEVYGFDMGTGLPKSDDYRDMPYVWSEGFYKMDRPKLEARLKRAKLIIGDVAQTVPTFFNDNKPAPIGVVMFDLDFYSSTMNAFKIFDQDPAFYLPRVQCYFDDLGTIEFVGELEAIREFNEQHSTKKLGNIYTLKYDRTLLGERLFEFHDFKHPKYNSPLYTDRQNPLKD